jgi:hypothetical protein
LDKLPNLQLLALFANPIEDFSPLLPFLQQGMALHYVKDEDNFEFKIYEEELQGIIGGNNPVTTPPPELLQQGTAAVLRYFDRK